MGRPPIELTEKRAARLLDATEKGLSRATAARLAGISPRLFFEWLARGRAGEEPFAHLVQRLKVAEARGEEAILNLVRVQAVESFQAAKWLLEVRNPRRYVVKQHVSHEVAMSEEQAKAKYRELTGKEWGT